MTVPIKRLPAAVVSEARARYQQLYLAALPGSGGLAAERIEVANFNCSETMAEFERVGLGLETVVIHRDESGGGHTGKVLMNLPGQLLLEHGHVDTIVLRLDADLAPGFLPLNRLINGFCGIRQCRSDATVATDAAGREIFLYRDDEAQIVQARDGLSPYPAERAAEVVAVFPGKSETFKAIYGDGVLFADTAQVVYAPPGARPDVIPGELQPLVDQVRREQRITTRGMIHMTGGMNVLLAKNTRHAFLGGRRGCVYLEFSTPSMDEADRFTDPRVIR